MPAASDAKAIAAPVYLPGRQRLGKSSPQQQLRPDHLGRAFENPCWTCWARRKKPRKQRAGAVKIRPTSSESSGVRKIAAAMSNSGVAAMNSGYVRSKEVAVRAPPSASDHP